MFVKVRVRVPKADISADGSLTLNAYQNISFPPAIME